MHLSLMYVTYLVKQDVQQVNIYESILNVTYLVEQDVKQAYNKELVQYWTTLKLRLPIS